MRYLPLSRRIAAVFFPERCAFCDCVVLPGEAVCAKCGQTLPRQERPLCLHCGLSKSLCTCKSTATVLDAVCAPFRYEGAVKRGILRFKQAGTSLTAAHYAREIADTVRQEFEGVRFDGVTFVPMQKSELRRREYNQSEWLAREVAKRLKLPLVPTLCKTFATKPQKEVPAAEREGNLRGALDRLPGADVTDKCFLVVDDVCTTGATLRECALILKIYGASAVYGATLAKTRLERGEERGGNPSGN